jgi:5-formaminoimidazole-4-carboxamide-1-beta-D-ribofuranosyl 5'-monophosphate synthetase
MQPKMPIAIDGKKNPKRKNVIIRNYFHGHEFNFLYFKSEIMYLSSLFP